MGSMPLALSIHNFISSVGADAGFAAIIGLAILVLLYFAHARETANLHDEASFLAQRLQEAEAQIALLTRQRAAPAPSPVQPAAVAAAPAPVPFAPAGVAAPALAAATRVVPLVAARVTRPATAAASAVGIAGVAGAVAGARPGPPVVATAAGAAPPTATPAHAPAPASSPATATPAGAPGPATATPATAPDPTPTAPRPTPRTAPAPASPSPIARPVPVPAAQARGAAPAPPAAPTATPSPGATPAPGATPFPASEERVSAPASAQPRGTAIAAGPPATVAGANGSGHVPSPPPPIQRPPARPAPAQGGGRRPPTPFLGAERSSSRARPVALIGGALGVAAVVVVLVLATSGGGAPTKSNGARTSNAPSTRHPPAFNPAKVTVAVLNGTFTDNLAHSVSARLTAIGFQKGAIQTAANQTVTSTIVGYLPHYRTDAMHVATALKLGVDAVQPVSQSALAVACPQPAPCTANVIVTVGSNLATT